MADSPYVPGWSFVPPPTSKPAPRNPYAGQIDIPTPEFGGGNDPAMGPPAPPPSADRAAPDKTVVNDEAQALAQGADVGQEAEDLVYDIKYPEMQRQPGEPAVGVRGGWDVGVFGGPETVGMKLGGVQDQAGAIQAKSKLQEEYHTGVQKIYGDVVSEGQRRLTDLDLRRAAADEEIQKRQADLDNRLNALSKERVSEGNYWANPFKALSNMALAFLPLAGTDPVRVIQLMDNNIQRDLETQRTNIENSRSLLEARKNTLQHFIENAGSRESGEYLFMAKSKLVAADRIEELASKMEAGAAKQNAVQMIGMLREKAADDMALKYGPVAWREAQLMRKSQAQLQNQRYSSVGQVLSAAQPGQPAQAAPGAPSGTQPSPAQPGAQKAPEAGTGAAIGIPKETQTKAAQALGAKPTKPIQVQEQVVAGQKGLAQMEGSVPGTLKRGEDYNSLLQKEAEDLSGAQPMRWYGVDKNKYDADVRTVRKQAAEIREKDRTALQKSLEGKNFAKDDQHVIAQANVVATALDDLKKAYGNKTDDVIGSWRKYGDTAAGLERAVREYSTFGEAGTSDYANKQQALINFSQKLGSLKVSIGHKYGGAALNKQEIERLSRVLDDSQSVASYKSAVNDISRTTNAPIFSYLQGLSPRLMYLYQARTLSGNRLPPVNR